MVADIARTLAAIPAKLTLVTNPRICCDRQWHQLRLT